MARGRGVSCLTFPAHANAAAYALAASPPAPLLPHLHWEEMGLNKNIVKLPGNPRRGSTSLLLSLIPPLASLRHPPFFFPAASSKSMQMSESV